MRPGKFGTRSRGQLDSCHPLLQQLFEEVVKVWDCSILCGHRNEADQEEAYATGRSALHWPNSKHNQHPSLAVDAAPWYAEESPHIPWEDAERFRAFGGFVLGVAYKLDIPIRWGGDWDGDRTFTDQRLIDMPHFELR